jgi:CHRD domain-containing protein
MRMVILRQQDGDVGSLLPEPQNIARGAPLVTVMVFGGAAFAGTILRANLTGALEVPGDPDGSGRARLDLMLVKEQICYTTLTVSNTGRATAAQIFTEAPPQMPTRYQRNRRHRAMALLRGATWYRDNVHNRAFPNGAVRGQLHNEFEGVSGLPDRGAAVHDDRLPG